MSTYNSLSQWKLLPVSSVDLTFATSGTHSFWYLVKGSTFSFKPVFASVKSNTGGEIIVGWRFEGKFITSQTNYTDMQATLEAIAEEQLIGMNLTLQYDEKMTIEFDSSNPATVQSLSCSFEINYNDSIDSPELTITVIGLLSKDAIDASIFNILFNQYWS